MAVKKVALLTAGGLAPCLSSAVGRLIERYSENHPTPKSLLTSAGIKDFCKGYPFPLPLKFVHKHLHSMNTAEALLATAG